MDSLFIGIGVLVLLVLGIIGFIISRLVTVPVSEALVISGSNGPNGDPKVATPGSRVFIIPILQSATSIPLTQLSLPLQVEGVDSNAIPVQLKATANIKIGNSPEDIRAAAERFSEYKNITQAVENNVSNVLLGSLRAIVSEMSVLDLLNKRNELGDRVKGIAEPELKGMGLVIDSLTINEITDTEGYIKSLSVPESEKVLKNARISKAKANQEANDAEVAAAIAVAEKRKNLEIKESGFRAETEKARAISESAGPLADAEQDKKIATVEALAAAEKATLRDRELDTEIRRPADARTYEVTKAAEAQKNTNIAIAEAEAESIKIKGAAEAEAIRQKGLAEAEAMEKKAEAYAKYNQAAVLQLIFEKLPEVAREIAAPMSNIDNLTVIGTEGASEVTKTVTNGFTQISGVVEGLTGFSLNNLLSGDTNNNEVSEMDEVVEIDEIDEVSEI